MKKLLIAAVILVATCTMASAGGLNRLGADLSVQNSWDLDESHYGWDGRHPRLRQPGFDESPYSWDGRHPRLRQPGFDESPYGWDGRHPRLR